MRLDFVEVCGFRGFRDKVRIDFGSGFTVITGRNGVGKSSLCDAIEFAITGSIDKYTVEKSARESLSDYLWWRGEGTPSAHYVTASFKGASGEPLTVTRTRETGADRTAAQIEAALCTGSRPEDALRQLCKTSIIRDEWIAALSVDLTETERFDLVRSALGPVEGADYGAKAKDVVSRAEATHERNESTYEAARTQLTNSLTQLSEAKDMVARSGDVAAALAVVTAATPGGPSDLLLRLAAGRAVLAARRASLAGAGEAVSRGREIAALRREYDAPEARRLRDAARQLVATTAAAKTQAESTVVQAQRELEIEEQADSIAASLSALVDHGQRLGLHDGHCPLCAANRSPEEFTAGLAIARSRIETLASGVTAARRKLASAREAALEPIAAHSQAESAWTAIEQDEARLIAREKAYVELFERYAQGNRVNEYVTTG